MFPQYHVTHACRQRARTPRHVRGWSRACVLAWAAAALLAVDTARAQEVHITHVQLAQEAPSDEPPGLGTTVGLAAAGAVTAFLLHETGHVLANLMLGNVPHFRGTMVWGFFPFFVIAPDITCRGDSCVKRDGQHFASGRNGGYFIVTAGFNIQNLTNEILLTNDPYLAERYAPFRKGLLAFNLFLSTIYALGTYTGLEAPNGDLRGASQHSGIHEAWLATLLMVPTVLDAYRYFHPTATWAAWVSRAGKATLFGVTFVF
jgi:hypothetical protein